MARQTRAVYLRGDTRAMTEGIATIASGENPDGTPFSVAVEGVEFTGTVDVVASGALTNRSGTITLGGTAQNAMASNASRKYLYLENPETATEDLWFRFTGTAAAASPSKVLHPGDIYEVNAFVPTQALSVFAATTAHAFTAEEG